MEKVRKYTNQSSIVYFIVLIIVGIFSLYIERLDQRITKQFDDLIVEEISMSKSMLILSEIEDALLQDKKINPSAFVTLRKNLDKLNIKLPRTIELLEQNKLKGAKVIEVIEKIHKNLELHNLKTLSNTRVDINEYMTKHKYALTFMIVFLLILFMVGYFINRMFPRAYEINRKLKEEVEHKNSLLHKKHQKELITNFSGGMAHEVNNSLATISGRAQIMLMKSEDQDVTKNIKIIMRQVSNIKGLIQQLLISSRGSCDELTKEDMSQKLKEIVQQSAHSDCIKAEIDIEENACVMCSLSELQLMIEEVIKNAIYFSPTEDKVVVKLQKASSKNLKKAKLDKSKQYIQVIIADKGVGIEDTSIIFNPFYTTKEVGDGVGLGLIMVLNLIHAIEGEILISSKKNKGTEICLLLPVCEQEEEVIV